MTFYKKLALNKINTTKDILDAIFGEPTKQELKEFLVLLFCKYIFRDYDSNVILKKINYDEIDVFDILIYDTMFYLFGLIDDPYKLYENNDKTQIEKAFNVYIGLNSDTKGFINKLKGGAIDCENLNDNLSNIVFNTELTTEEKAAQINELLKDNPLNEQEQNSLKVILERTRRQGQDINMAQFDFITNRCAEELAAQRRENREQQQRLQELYTQTERSYLNNLNKVIAKQALFMLEYCNKNGEKYSM